MFKLPVVLVAKDEASIIIIRLKLFYDMKRAGVSHVVKPVVSNGDPNITVTVYISHCNVTDVHTTY